MSESINASNFSEKVLKSDLPVIVDFFATWCGPCKMMAPVVEQMAAELAGKANVYSVDIDQCPDLAQQYGVMSIPTFVCFKNGAAVKQAVGAQPKEELLKLLA